MTTILIVGIAVAVFVGFNIGGSSGGVSWGVPVGAYLISKTWAAALFIVFIFLGGWTVGRNVMGTLSTAIIPSEMFTLGASIAILLFIGLGILIANLFGVPVPTSMTAVGSIAGLGLATDTLYWETMGRIVSWWLLTPVLAFWIGGIVGRYIYPYLDRVFQSHRSEGALLVVDRTGMLPRIRLGPNTTYHELVSVAIVLCVACYMSFSAGASNVPNAVAPLVGSGSLDVNLAIIIATLAIGLGGFTIARRTMNAVGNDLTRIPLLAAVVVAITAATITTGLSYIGIPISLVMATVMTIVGLGWGRASRTATIRDMARGTADVDLSMNALTVEQVGKVRPIGQETVGDLSGASDLVRPRAVARFVSLWIAGPSVSLVLSYSYFSIFPMV